MPITTRTSNKNASFQAYYTKKIPKQRNFPHRRKIVREKQGHGQDVREPKQMTFLPEKMRRQLVKDSEDEYEEGGEDEEVDKSKDAVVSRRGKKRSRETVEEDQEPVRSSPKRRRRATPKKRKPRFSPIDAESTSDDEEPAPPASSHLSESEEKEDTRSRRRRQSTMTQLVDGLGPQPRDEEPQFKRIESGRARRSLSKVRGKDKQQRTLTQMVPGLMSSGITSDEDMEEDTGEDGEAYNNALAVHFAEQGVFQPNADQNIVEKGAKQRCSARRPKEIASFDPDADGEDSEDEYEPTQDVHAPILRVKRRSRRVSRRQSIEPSATENAHPTPQKCATPRFSLLSTPEKRKIREIPSSQSPSESLLSTQSAPASRRLPLRARSGNTQNPPETPSRRKRVTFQAPAEDANLLDLAKRKFRNFVQDSEGEDEDLVEEDDELTEGQEIGTETQASILGINNAIQGRNIGSETQAILDQIDQACAHADEDAAWREMEPSQELVSVVDARHSQHSQDLEEQQCDQADLGEASSPHNSLHRLKHTRLEQEFNAKGRSSMPPPLAGLTTHQYELNTTNVVNPAHHDEVHIPEQHEGVKPTGSPIFIKDEPESDEAASPTPLQDPGLAPHSTPYEPTDLDGEPIQVARSPTPAHPETQETSRSQCSKAEQQLQSEWFSYSQYPHAAPSSSMRVIQDGNSYQANPFSDPAVRELAPPQWSAPLSQATTVDGTQITPKRTPEKRILSANTTPHRISSSQPTFTSPDKAPPMLVIPSSFPSPSRSYRDWSSPVLGMERSQMMGLESVEDFSIPALPPLDDDIEDEDEDL